MGAKRDIAGKHFLVVGLGKSGVAAARLLLARGAKVTANDVRDEAALGEVAASLKAAGASLHLGDHPESPFTSVDGIIVSPGVPRLPALDAADAAGVPIAGEIELASWFLPETARVVGITGTNGKSTVTTLIGEMCAEAGLPVFVGGNLGTPLVDVVTDGKSVAAREGAVVVVELSSYQLERVDHFRAHVGLFLNVSPDHLDRYDSYADYVAAKGNLFVGQREGDFAIALVSDGATIDAAKKSAGTLLTFGDFGDVRVEDGHLVDPANGLDVPTSALRMRGRHNMLNACAAALAARCLDIPAPAIDTVLRRFAGLPHRMEHVRDLAGVAYFDDSKATNVGAAVAAVAGLAPTLGTGRIVLIAGGKDKGGGYAQLVEAHMPVARAVVTVGEAAPLVEAAYEAFSLPIERASDMDEAVRIARRSAQRGDAVVLAPACSSFDMFKSYAHRGDVFQDAVRGLPEVDDEQAAR